MASFSDDETFELESIKEQRKRKGALEYLVQWKGVKEETWEPAKNLAADCAEAIQIFLQKQKKSKRASSGSRKSSRSRSRSSSRSRKSSASKTKAKSQSKSRSRSRGRAKKEAAPVEKAVKQVEENTEPERSLRSRKTLSLDVTDSADIKVKAATPVREVEQNSVEKPKPEPVVQSPGRQLRSSTMVTRQQLEVQRVHNEQRPVHKDDSKPRSAIWKIADYAVIILFILSLLAALVLFLEKFFDLSDFKKQAYPNLEVLRRRLMGAQERIVELVYSVLHFFSDAWIYLMEQVKGKEEVVKTASDKAAAGA